MNIDKKIDLECFLEDAEDIRQGRACESRPSALILYLSGIFMSCNYYHGDTEIEDAFQAFLCEKFDVKENIDWSTIFGLHTNKDTIFQVLPDLLDEFARIELEKLSE
jgi:hypothetical protein